MPGGQSFATRRSRKTFSTASLIRLCDTVRGPFGAERTYEPVVFFAVCFGAGFAAVTLFRAASAERCAAPVCVTPAAFVFVRLWFNDIELVCSSIERSPARLPRGH